MDPLPLTVTELTRHIKALLEENLDQVVLRGEISNLARPNSGHIYFNVKDEELDKTLISLEQQGLVKLYRGRRGIQLAKATYEGLNKANPPEYYQWFPSWVDDRRKF